MTKRKAVAAGVALVLGLGLLAVVRTRSGEAASFPVVGILSIDLGAPRDEQLRRTLQLAAPDVAAAERADGTACSGGYPPTGFSDIAMGAAVTVADERGTIIATGHLGPGRLSGSVQCVFTFAVDVPRAKLYRFEVSSRGRVQKSFEEMKAGGWTVFLTLG